MGDTWWVIIICPCVNVFSLMGGVTEADVGFQTEYVLFGGEQYGCFPAAQILAKHLNYFIIT
jgi:hypothetical protein